MDTISVSDIDGDYKTWIALPDARDKFVKYLLAAAQSFTLPLPVRSCD
jgi:hypothetical protein